MHLGSTAASVGLVLILSIASQVAAQNLNPLTGTLVVAVPISEGLVACADKRLFNADTGTFTDNNIKIRKVGDSALFVATNTVGFYDVRSRKMVFDAFEITERYVSKHGFADRRQFWDGLKKEIRDQLRAYFAARKFTEWPESDKANKNLLFNLVFYSVSDNRAISHSLRVFYEKARTPVVYIPGVVREVVRSPKLSGKGNDLINYLSRNPAVAQDPLILRFDQTRFDPETTTSKDAVDFARKLFQLSSTALPQAQVSATFDCAILDYRNGFQWMRSSLVL